MGRTAEPLAAKEQTEFQRHIEARQIGCGVETRCGEVVYAELALLDDPLDFGEPQLARVVFLQGTTCDESEIVDGEYAGFEDGFVGIVKRAVNKYVIAVQNTTLAAGPDRTSCVSKPSCRLPSQSLSTAGSYEADPAPSADRASDVS